VNSQATQVAIKAVFVEQYKDRIKSVKVFNKLYMLCQRRMTIKKLNREFNSLIVNLKPKPADAELRRVYVNMLKLEATAEQLRRIVGNATIFKVLIEMEDWENWFKEQEATYYKTLEKASTSTTTISNESTSMNIEKRVKICHYCKKLGYVIADCRKKAANINKMSKEKKKIRCYCCDQIEHMVKDCKNQNCK
jgi:hypothetical protein